MITVNLLQNAVDLSSWRALTGLSSVLESAFTALQPFDIGAELCIVRAVLMNLLRSDYTTAWRH